jgi:serine/threonine protein kinase
MTTELQIPVFSTADNETKVRETLVFPLLKALGYNNEEIAPEVSLLFRHKDSPDRADYIVSKEHKYGLATNKLVVEVKRPSIELPSSIVLEQAQEYAYHPSVQGSFVLLTNGIVLEIYSSSQNPPQLRASFKADELTQNWKKLDSLIGAESLASYFADFKLIASVGKGGYGEVFKARNEKLRRNEAIKILLTGGEKAESWLHRFERGAQGLAALRHPYICEIYEINTYRGRSFYRMEYIDGSNLTDFVNHYSLSLPERLILFGKICDALSFAHQRGVFHCDLKPENILVQSDYTPKLIDFDFCHINNRSVTLSSQIITTLAYMDPTIWEAESGQPVRDHLTDIFSIGLLLWSILTGKKLTIGWTPQYLVYELSQILEDSDAKNLACVILECIHRSRAQRPQSVEEVGKLLGLKDRRKSLESGIYEAGNIFALTNDRIAFQYHFRLWETDNTIPSSTDFERISKNIPQRSLTAKEKEFIFRSACEHWSIQYRPLFKGWEVETLIRNAETVLTDLTIASSSRNKVADTSPARKAVNILCAADSYLSKDDSEKSARFLLSFLTSGRRKELFHTILEDLSKLQCYKRSNSKFRSETTELLIALIESRLPNASGSNVSQIGKLLEKLDPKICGEDTEAVVRFISKVASNPILLDKAVRTLTCFGSAHATDQLIAMLVELEKHPDFEKIARRAIGLGGRHKRIEVAQHLRQYLPSLKDSELIHVVKKLCEEQNL